MSKTPKDACNYTGKAGEDITNEFHERHSKNRYVGPRKTNWHPSEEVMPLPPFFTQEERAGLDVYYGR